MADTHGEPQFRRLRTPRAAAVAGIIFGTLFATSIVLLGTSLPATASEPWIRSGSKITTALLLTPIAGIAFLWFIGVLRDRFGNLEDRFFATVFLGSGLLFLAMTFVSMAIAGALYAVSRHSTGSPDEIVYFGREVMLHVNNVYAIRMAAVFMISLGTIWLRTGLMPRLEVPALVPGLPNITASERDHEQTIATLVRDDTIPVDVRLPCLLIAVYGFTAARILTLQHAHLHDTGDAVDLHVGDRPLRLPEPLTDLARTQLARHPDAGPQDWLFPGRQPGRPRHALYLTGQLRMLGTSISALQKTARFRLAGAVPAKVLADMLDFNVTMFETYARLAGANRGDYPALRSHQSEQFPIE